MRTICSIISDGILIILGVIAAALLLPMLFGNRTLAVLSGSMEPKIPVGAAVYVQECSPYALEVGDIITYQMGSSTLVTHRIVNIDEETQEITPQGDANHAPDSAPVAFASVVGKVVFWIPLLGYLSIYIKTPLGIAVGCGILIVLILLNFLPDILTEEEEGSAKKRRKKRAAAGTTQK